MNIYLILNTLSFLIFLQFVFISIMEINRKGKLNRNLFLFSLLLTFLSYSFLTLIFLRSNIINDISLILYFCLSIILLIYLICSLLDFSFIRMRLFFIPYFFIFIFLSILSFYFNENLNYLKFHFLENKLLGLHIIISFLSYSLLTVSCISSTVVLFQEKNLKNIFNTKISFLKLFPSIYEGEKITIRLIFITQFFLLMSLTSGFFYNKEFFGNQNFFTNEKILLSMITFILISILLFVRYFYGLTGKKIFSIVLLSFLFINFAYFGLKLIN